MQWNTCPRDILQDSLPGPTIGKVILVSTDEGIGNTFTYGNSQDDIFEILRHIRQHFSFVKMEENLPRAQGVFDLGSR